MDNKKLNIVVITQPDQFFIPKNIERLLVNKNINVLSCIVLNGPNSLNANAFYFVKGFGLGPSIRMAAEKMKFKFFDFMSSHLKLQFGGEYSSIRSLCRRHRINYMELMDINSLSALKKIGNFGPDCIVSFSAPIVFKEDLLKLPKFGCINLHCSMIPAYCGVLPSFWSLLDGKGSGGATVHVMDDKIDNGAVLAQCSFDFDDNETLFTANAKAKLAGGELMEKTLVHIAYSGKWPLEIPIKKQRQYFSWPTSNDFAEFRKRGRKLI